MLSRIIPGRRSLISLVTLARKDISGYSMGLPVSWTLFQVWEVVEGEDAGHHVLGYLHPIPGMDEIPSFGVHCRANFHEQGVLHGWLAGRIVDDLESAWVSWRGILDVAHLDDVVPHAPESLGLYIALAAE